MTLKKGKNRTLVSPRNPAGFRDYSPEEQMVREEMRATITSVYRRFGFLPLETACGEFLETLVGLSATPDCEDSSIDDGSAKMIFELVRLRGKSVANKSRSKDAKRVALRFDLTVPLARYASAHLDQIRMPFKRYQYGNVWRGERPQQGRFCEFSQFDADTLGDASMYADAETIWLMHDTLIALGVENFEISVNNRKIFDGLPYVAGFDPVLLHPVMNIVDKTDKIGLENVLRDLHELLPRSALKFMEGFLSITGQHEDVLERLLGMCHKQKVMVEGINELQEIAVFLTNAGVPSTRWHIALAVVRGLGYYTGPIFETTFKDAPEFGSVCSGGRYDGLVKRFSNVELPAVGASIGFDRLFSALLKLKRVNLLPTSTQVLVTIMESNRKADYVRMLASLRNVGIRAELYQGGKLSFRAQLAFANKQRIPLVVIAGSREFESGSVQIKNMSVRETCTVAQADLVGKVQSILALLA